MNFVGHALAATWVDSDPRFALGAMLPDFASMAAAGGPRVPLGDDHGPVVQSGIAWHHRTDHAFHGCAAFLELTDAGTAALRDAGLGRGASLAAAHVGVELLLDGELCHDPALVRHYHGALACDAELAPPLRAVVRRLEAVGTPHWYRDTGEVATRLFRILGARPRLAIAAEQQDGLGEWLRAVQPTVRDATPGLVAELRARLT
jgi:hypothetical protein